MIRSVPPLVCVLVSALAAHTSVSAQEKAPTVGSRLSRALEGMVQRPHVVNSVAIVDFGDSSWSEAEGFADPVTKTPMTTQHQFRTASVAKTFTAVVILQLIEEGKLRLDGRVGRLLSKQLRSLDRSSHELQITDGSKLGNLVTVKHLLTHSSGIPDYFGEKSTAGSQKGRSFADVFLTDIGGPVSRVLIDRRWEPIDLLKYYFDNELAGHAKFRPGEGFRYSDTNYLLLGLIIEQQTGRSLAINVRKRILEPLGMQETYYEWREPARGGPLAHHFWVVDGKNHDFVQEDLFGSFEWANGGMVTTVADLNLFVRGLFANKLFKSKQTFGMLLDVRNGKRFDKPHKYLDRGDSKFDAYTFGLARWQVLDRFECWGHTGFFGIGMFYFPKSDVSVVFANNQVDASVIDDLSAFAKILVDANLLGIQ